jgi:16S rRNA (adenine1518-N6/adenine1519-N6)-dimethyltransferase
VTPQPLGQHFLSDSIWRSRIAQIVINSGTLTGGTCIEIGAGHGEMTTRLAEVAARVIAIELDSQLLPRLAKNVAHLPNVTVVPGDVLKHDLAKLAAVDRFTVYGNLPYYITSPIVHQLLEHADKLQAAFLLVQLEVAERMSAQPGGSERGYFSAFTQFYSRPEIALHVPPGAFNPPPKVDSALIALKLPGERINLNVALEDEPAFLSFLKTSFTQKRKMLRNNLRVQFPAATIAAAMEQSSIPGNARAEQLTLSQLATLFAAIHEAHTK